MKLWVFLLLSAAVLAKTSESHDLLCRAAEEGDVAQVHSLLEHGTNPNRRDENGQTPLMLVAELKKAGAKE